MHSIEFYDDVNELHNLVLEAELKSELLNISEKYSHMNDVHEKFISTDKDLINFFSNDAEEIKNYEKMIGEFLQNNPDINKKT